jgi:hypothetical protein
MALGNVKNTNHEGHAVSIYFPNFEALIKIGIE